ncbi:hypothetical protein D3C78_789400 [compost metagenome]
MASGEFGQIVEADDRIGAQAVEALGQQGDVGLDALPADVERFVEGRLVVIEGAIGRAMQLAVGQLRIGQ